MLLPGLFKTYKNRQFTYKPVYYDKVKDDLKERVNKVENELTINSNENYRIGITHGSIRRFSKVRAKSRVRSNTLLLIIIFLLFTIAYLLLFK